MKSSDKISKLQVHINNKKINVDNNIWYEYKLGFTEITVNISDRRSLLHFIKMGWTVINHTSLNGRIEDDKSVIFEGILKTNVIFYNNMNDIIRIELIGVKI